VPLRYLQEVQGYRPLQSNLITLEIAAAQLVMLPPWRCCWITSESIRALSAWPIGIDPSILRWFILLTVYWNRTNSIYGSCSRRSGQPMVIMPLLMMTTIQLPARRRAFRCCTGQHIAQRRRGRERLVRGAD